MKPADEGGWQEKHPMRYIVCLVRYPEYLAVESHREFSGVVAV